MIRDHRRLRTKLGLVGALLIAVIAATFLASLLWLEGRNISVTQDANWSFYKKLWTSLVHEKSRAMAQNANIVRQNKKLIKALKKRDQAGIGENVENVWNQLSGTVSVLFFWTPEIPDGEILFWIDHHKGSGEEQWNTVLYQARLLGQVAKTRQEQTGFEWSHEGQLLLITATPFFGGPRTPYNIVAQGVDVNKIGEEFQKSAGVESVTLIRTNQADFQGKEFKDSDDLAIYRYPLSSIHGEVIGIVEVRERMSLTTEAFSQAQVVLATVFGLTLIASTLFIYLFISRLITRITGIQETLSAITHGSPVPEYKRPKREDELSIVEANILRQGSELADKQERLESALRDLEMERDKATKASEAKSLFVAHMSHELRTPLNAVIGLSHLALKTELNNRQRDYVNKTKLAGENLLGIINSILDFSKIEAGKMTLESIDFDPYEILENLSHMVGVKAEEKDIELIFSTPLDIPCRLNGDPLRLGQVLVNLANNAIKFTESGEIIVSTRLLEETEDRVNLEFSVQDSGIGLTEEQMSNVFQSFSQADSSTTRKYGGTGLGLTICKQLVNLMGGDLSVESVPGEGATFTFFAPFAKPAAAYRMVPVALSTDIRGANVLVVDDNKISRRTLRETLEAMSFRVTTVNSGIAALAELKLNGNTPGAVPYKLILMDRQMPDMDGIETTRIIKNDADLGQMPVVVMVTAHGREAVREQAYEAGMDGFLVKPVNPTALLDSIMAAFGNEIARPQAWQAGECEAEVQQFLDGARILLVEDNKINQLVATELLEGVGLVVEIAGTGREAVEMVRTRTKDNAFDGVLMDLQMPDMDGYEATRTIRQDLGETELPIIAMTAHAMEAERQKCIDAGMCDHVAKPVEPETLFATLLKRIKPRTDRPSAATQETAPLRAGDEVLPGILPPFDIEAALERVSGNRKFLGELILYFHDEYNDLIPTLNRMIESGEHQDAKRLAHTLKGAAGNLGANDVFEKAGALECGLDDGLTKEIPELISNLEAALSSAIQAAATLQK